MHKKFVIKTKEKTKAEEEEEGMLREMEAILLFLNMTQCEMSFVCHFFLLPSLSHCAALVNMHTHSSLCTIHIWGRLCSNNERHGMQIKLNFRIFESKK